MLENFFNYISGKTIAFCGLGASNMPLIKLFWSKGAKIFVCDKSKPEKLEKEIEQIKEFVEEFRFGENYLKNLEVDIVFRTPGMRFFSAELQALKERGTIITSEMEVFFELCPCKIIGVTGSDGKTTTTTIISEILKQSGKKVYVGGNIGTPLLPQIEKIKKEDWVVAELSSFQLISMRKSPQIAVVTNITPNHLDMHYDMQEYVNAKKNIFLHQNAFGRTILSFENEKTHSFDKESRSEPWFFSRKQPVKNGAYLAENGDLTVCEFGKETCVLNKEKIKIPGKHNIENYLAAICAVWGYADIDDIKNVAENFAGVEHRNEFVREINGVKYFNDSIASSPTRTISGTLSLYKNKIILIAGGYDKKIPFEEIGKIIPSKVKILILMGQTAKKIKDCVVNSLEFKENMPIIIEVNNMQEAVKTANKLAVSGDIVALSPCCASFDLYKNFIERGNHFKDLVNLL